jgi:uncharacterized membrane protein
MTEQNLLLQTEQLERETGRPLQTDRDALLHDFHEDQEHEGTLAMKILSIIGAFMATGFFIGFTFLLDVNSEVTLQIMGATMLVGGYFFCRRDFLGIMGEAFGVALVVCGYPLLLVGFADLVPNESGMALFALVLAGVILFLMENSIIAFLATVMMGGCLIFLAHDGYDRFGAHLYVGLVAIALTLWVQFEARLLKASELLSRRYDGIRTGLILALLIGAGYLSDFRFMMDLPRLPNWYASVALVPLTLWLAYTLLQRFGVAATERWLYLVGLLTLLLPTIFAPALSATLLCLLLAWRAGHRTGTVLAVLALIYFISRYYYDLNLTLLTKSIILSATGSLFLVAWALLRKKISLHETIAPGPGGH